MSTVGSFHPERIVHKLIVNVKDGDIYNEIPAYPNPDHRSFALANQAAMLYVAMFFSPDLLANESSKLREFVDKHFYDNWVIPVFMGYVVDLTNEWQTYDAAKRAIDNTISPRAIRAFAEKQKANSEKIVNKLVEDILPTGILTNDTVLQKMDNLLNLLRDANTAYKWLMLHRLTVREDLRQVVLESARQSTVLSLLLYTAQFELLLYRYFKDLIDQRDLYWEKHKNRARDNLFDIAEHFSTRSSFKTREANDDYSEYFAKMSKKVDEVTVEGGSGHVTRKIQKYIKGLEDIEKYDQIENNIQVRAHIDDSKKRLKAMIKVLNLKKRLLTDFKRIADSSYSFLILKDYIQQMQKVIQKDASSTLLLRATFMKLSSIMDAPMTRIIQLDMLCSSENAENAGYNSNFRSVSNYYSTELMNFVKEVLQVIPRRVFELAGQSLVKALTPKIKSMPGEIDQEDLRDYALFEKRAKIAGCIGEIAVYMNGVMNMDKYMIGNFQVVPMKILEEGLRCELLSNISSELDRSLRFANCQSFKEVEAQLTKTGQNLDSLKCSVEYIQDLVCVYGLKIWYDEYNKLVSTYIDVEWNYVRRKELPDEALKWASSQNQDYSSLSSSIKTGKLKVSEKSLTFLGRVINSLMTYSDPKRYSYIPNTLSFLDEDTREFTVTMQTFGLVKKCIGVNGLYGIDRLLGFMIVSEMYNLQSAIQKILQKDKQNILAESSTFSSLNKTVKGIDKFYSLARKRLRPQLEQLTTIFEKVGHLVTLRVLTLNELSLSARKDSQKLYMLLETTNAAFLNELAGAESNLQKEEIDAQNIFIQQLASLSCRVGLADPREKVYFKPKGVEFAPLLAMYCLYSITDQVTWDPALSMLTRSKKKGARVDPIRLLLGITVCLNQYSEEAGQLLLYYIAQYIRSCFGQEPEKKKEDASQQKEAIQSLLLIFVQLVQLLGLDPKTTEQILPVSLLALAKKFMASPSN